MPTMIRAKTIGELFLVLFLLGMLLQLASGWGIVHMPDDYAELQGMVK